MIEKALKTIGDWISKETESRKYPKGELLDLSESLQALKASIASQSVTDEAVQRAIEWAEQEREYNFRYMKFGDADSASLAITALRQMRTEPCEWCEWTDNGYRIEYNLIDEDGHCCPDMDHFVVTGIATYCPNCGRKLVK